MESITEKPKAVTIRDEALIYLRFDLESIYTAQGSAYWLEGASNLACERVTERRGDMVGRLVLRERRGEKTFNHWTHTVQA